MPRRLLTAVLAACCGAAAAQTAPPPSAAKPDEQVVVPQIDRRDVKTPKFPSNDFEIGLFGGIYQMESFGSSPVAGVRLGYHVTEDVFVEGVYAQTTVSDENFRPLLGGASLFPDGKGKVTYYNLSAGWNVMPGEVFFGSKVAKASAFYIIGGVGSTKLPTTNPQNQQTFNFGFGTRLLFNDHFAIQVDVRDHIFSFDLLGTKRDAKNLEATFGLTVYF